MISNVSFGQASGVWDPVNVDKPQTYVRPEAAQPDSFEKTGKKKHKAAKVIAGVVGTALVIAGLLATAKHFKVFDAEKVAQFTKKFEGKKWISWAKKPVETVSKGLDVAGNWCLNAGVAVKDAVVGIFKKKPAAAAEGAAAAAGEGAAAATAEGAAAVAEGAAAAV